MAKRRTEGLNGVSELYMMRQLAERNQPPDDPEFAALYPKLFSILSDVKISESQLIDPPILSIRNAAGDWLLSLSVPGLRMYGDALGSTFQAALANLEARLANPDQFWKVNVKKPVIARDVKRKT